MHFIFDAPIASDAPGKGFRRFQKRGDIVASLGVSAQLSAVLELALTLDAHQGLQPWPRLDVIESCAKANDPLFQPPMPFTELGVAGFSDIVGLNAFVQIALIAFEGTQVVIFGVNDELTGFFGC